MLVSPGLSHFSRSQAGRLWFLFKLQAIFFGVLLFALITSRGEVKRRFKDSLSTSLKTFNIDMHHWHTTAECRHQAQDRSVWWTHKQSGPCSFQDGRMKEAKKKGESLRPTARGCQCISTPLSPVRKERSSPDWSNYQFCKYGNTLDITVLGENEPQATTT